MHSTPPARAKLFPWTGKKKAFACASLSRTSNSEHVCSYIQKIICKNVTYRTKWGEGTGGNTRKDSIKELKPSLRLFITVKDIVTGRAPAPYLSRTAEEYATSYSVIPAVHPLSSAKQMDSALTELSSQTGAGGRVINITVQCCYSLGLIS